MKISSKLIVLLALFIINISYLSSVSSARIIYDKEFGTMIKERQIKIKNSNIIDVPLNCPPGYLIDHTRRCRKAWT